MKATGTFDVQLHPLAMEEIPSDALLGRLSIDKQFHGDLQGTSKGQMMTSSTGVTGSAAYVAVERVTGTIGGRSGTFALYHVGLMDRGAQKLSIAVVPDSGTGAFAGMTGTLGIEVANGEHKYTLDYTLRT